MARFTGWQRRDLTKQIWIAVLVALAGLAFPLEAQAAKIPIPYHNGDDIFVAGDGSLPAPLNADPQLAGAQAGYKCKIFGVLWAYFTISDCKPVAFKGDTFWDDPEVAAVVEKGHPPSEMKVGIWQKHGRILLGIGILGLGALFIWSKISGSNDDDDEESASEGQSGTG